MTRNDLVWIGLVMFFYFAITGMDFIVHCECYKFGLIFNSSWANRYWFALACVIFAVSLLVGFSFYMQTKDKWNAFRYGFTIVLLAAAGLVDWIFYFYVAALPSGDWTWMLQYHFFGTWDWLHQLLQTIIVLQLTFSMWRFKRAFK